MTKFEKTFVATAMALALGTPAFAGGDSVVGSPVSASVSVPYVPSPTVIVADAGISGEVNVFDSSVGGGFTSVPISSLPAEVQAVIQTGGGQGGSISSRQVSTFVGGILTDYFIAN